jgi:hypothetical protein
MFLYELLYKQRITEGGQHRKYAEERARASNLKKKKKKNMTAELKFGIVKQLP